MEAAHVPQTVKELERWMKERCYNFESYSIGGNNIYEGFSLEKTRDGYEWYYTERGQRTTNKVFATEQEATAYAWQQIMVDKWATAHYVGLTSDAAEARELAVKLRTLGIAFWQDEIPNFYGAQRAAYRTFVAGCDIRRAEPLRRRYYHKP